MESEAQEDDLKDKGVEIAKQLGQEAISRLMKQFSDTEDNSAVEEKLRELFAQGIDDAAEGKKYQEILKNGAKSAGMWLAEECANRAFSGNVFKDTGKETKQSDSQEKSEADTPADVLQQELSSVMKDCLIAYIHGEENIGEKLQNDVKDKLISLVDEKGEAFIQNAVKEGIAKFKKSGKQYRARNREINAIGDILSAEVAQKAVESIHAVLSDDKKALEAIKECAWETGKNSAEQYLKERGAALAVKAINVMVKAAEKNIGNQAVRYATVKGLKKLANKNVVVNIAATVIDLREAIRAYSNNEISEMQFLRKVGEPAAGAALSSAFTATIGTVAGPATTLVAGPMLGYIAAEMMFKAVFEAQEEARIAQERAQMIHAMVEESIKRMKEERENFERATAELFAHREAVIETCFKTVDAAFEENDFDELTKGLEILAKEFGREMKFKNMQEFDSFMNDDSQKLIL